MDKEIKVQNPGNLQHQVSLVTEKSFAVDLEGVTSDRFSLFYVNSPARVRKVVAMVEGSTPSAVINVEYSKDTTLFTPIMTDNVTVASTTTPLFFFPTSSLVPSDSYLWLNVASVGGTVDHLHLTIIYEQ